MQRATQSSPNTGATWILESRSFFAETIKDTMTLIREQGILDQTDGNKLEELWLNKFKPRNHRPDFNYCELSKRLPRKRARKPKKPAKKMTTTASLMSTKGTEAARGEETFVDANTLDDNLDIIYQIQFPQLRPSWSIRIIDLKIKAYVIKRNLIEPLLNWQLLDSVMILPLPEATALLQSHVDQMLQTANI